MSERATRYMIVRMTPEQEEDWNRVRGGGPGQCSAYTLGCSGNTRKHPCKETVKWHCTYDYVTGMKGRVSTANRHYCDDHTRRFCRSHKLLIPNALLEVEDRDTDSVPLDPAARLKA